MSMKTDFTGREGSMTRERETESEAWDLGILGVI